MLCTMGGMLKLRNTAMAESQKPYKHERQSMLCACVHCKSEESAMCTDKKEREREG